MKAIISDQVTQKHKVSIFDVVTFENCKVAGFFEGYDNLGYAVFVDDGNSNYIFKSYYIEDRTSDTDVKIAFSSFVLKNENILKKVIVIISNNPKLARIEQVVNNADTKSISVSKNPCVILLTNDYEGPYQAVYHLYDENDQLLTETDPVQD